MRRFRFAPAALAALVIAFVAPAVGQAFEDQTEGSGQVTPAGRFTPDEVQFGDVGVGKASKNVVVELKSVGNVPLPTDSVELEDPTGQFALVGETCKGTSLAPGETCSITVAFRPTTLGLQGAAVRVKSNEFGQIGFTLDGQGVTASGPPADDEASLKVKAPATLKAGRVVRVKATATNSGDTTLSGLKFKVRVPMALLKKPAAVKLPKLAPGASVKRTIRVKVKPSALDTSRPKVPKIFITLTDGATNFARNSVKVRIPPRASAR